MTDELQNWLQSMMNVITANSSSLFSLSHTVIAEKLPQVGPDCKKAAVGKLVLMIINPLNPAAHQEKSSIHQ